MEINHYTAIVIGAFVSAIQFVRRSWGLESQEFPMLNAKLVNRMVYGNKVIDEEYVTGRGEKPIKAIAIYEVHDELIQKVWFIEEK